MSWVSTVMSLVCLLLQSITTNWLPQFDDLEIFTRKALKLEMVMAGFWRPG